LSNCACPENRVAQKFFTVLNILFILNNLRLPWKTEGALNSLYRICIFIIQDFWATSACPKKQSCPAFFTVLKYFLSFRIFQQLVLALNKRVALKIFTVWHIPFTFRVFEQFALALKNRGCPEFTVMNIYILSFRIFEQLALALKNRVVLEFFTVLKYILSFRIFEQLALAL